MVKPGVKERSFRKELVQEFVALSTSGFGLVVALAWNETIQQVVKEFIEPRIPGSGLIAKLIYALLITILAVLITFQLSKLASRWGSK
mgnify:CR=1 FL=1